MARLRFRKQRPKIDSKLLVLSLILTAIGLVAVADVSAPQALSYFSDKFYFARQQVLFAVVGFVVLAVSSKIHYNFWKRIATPLFLASLVLLILVLIPAFGANTLSAKRWLILGPFSFQPSELVKLALAVFLAKVSVSGKKELFYFLPLGLVVFLVMLEPDLGTTLVIGMMGMAQIFVAGIGVLYFSVAALLAGFLSFLLVIFSDYRKERFLTFLESARDPLDKSYHIRQVLLALGSGGFFGVGLGHSRQKYLFLPEAATDSIFAIIAEEIGFLGAAVLVVLFTWFVIRALKISGRAPDKFSQVLAVGLAVWIGGQIFLNIASMVALVPLTGIPLPFLSYGGTSLVMVLLATGILLNISSHAKKEK